MIDGGLDGLWLLLGLCRVGLTLGLSLWTGTSSNGICLPLTHWSVRFFFTSFMLSLIRFLCYCKLDLLFSRDPTDFLCDSLTYPCLPCNILGSSVTSSTSTLYMSPFGCFLLWSSQTLPCVYYFKFLYLIGGNYDALSGSSSIYVIPFLIYFASNVLYEF